MNFKKITSLAKIGLSFLLILSCIYTYNSMSKSSDIFGIPYSFIDIINTLGIILILLYFNALSIKTYKTLSFNSFILLGLVGGILNAITIIINLIQLTTYNVEFVSYIPTIVLLASALILILSIKEMRSYSISNFNDIVKLKLSFKTGLISTILGLIIHSYYLYSSFIIWKQVFGSWGEWEYRLNSNMEDALNYQIIGLPYFTLTIIKVIAYILLLLFFIMALKNVEKINDYFKSKEFIQNSTTNKNSKSSNMKKVIFTIIGAILGLPLSYYFQPDMVQAKIGGINGYIQHFDEILDAKDLIGNVVMGVIVFAIIGFIIGYFMDKNANSKTD